MKRILFIILLLSFSLYLRGEIKVAATIFPLYDMVREIAGDKAEVKLIVPPGASPHLFGFTPGKLQDLQGSRIIFCIGNGADDWVKKVKDALRGTKIFTVDKGISLIPAGRSFKGNITYNPHYWLGIPEAVIISRNIKNVLQAEDPDNASFYQANFAKFSRRLLAAQERYIKMLSPYKNRKIVTFHAAWVYFARFLNLQILGTFEPSGTGEPSPRHIANLTKKIRKYGVKVIFIEPQLNSRVLDAFVKDTGLKIKILDPLGGIGGRESYLKLMDYNVKEVQEALESAR